MTENLLKNLKIWSILSTFLIIFPQNSILLDATFKFSTIQATCVYKYELENIYTCDLISSVYSDPKDILEIIGNHTEGLTDADVHAVNYRTNGTAYFNGEVMKKFVNLRSLNFIGSGIKEISQNAFEICPNLEEFSGYLHQIESLPPQMLKNCENLRIFSLSAQSIDEIPEDLFGATENLEKFKLEAAFGIETMPENLFLNMRNLRILELSGNRLTELSPNFLINTVNLEEVDLSFNNFEDQWKMIYALNGHPNMRKILLSYNSFTNFDFRFFSQFQKLEELAIGTSYWNFTDITWMSLPSSLLDLNVNGIGEEIPENSFDRLVNLRSMILSGRGIVNLHKDTFKALTKLESLEVYLTSIKTLHPELFMSLINLSDLDFGFNRIEELPVGIFAGLGNIGSKSEMHGIKMSFNKISRLNADSFGLHPHLRYIRFYQNIINEIEYGIFGKFHANLTIADFRYNMCINGTFSGENLDDHDLFSMCHQNWDEIIPTTSTTTEATTPSGVGRDFKKFEIFFVIFIGFVKVSMNFY